MTTVGTPDFNSLRREATRGFAQTMIVIDDEASQGAEALGSKPVVPIHPPTRRTRSTATAHASAKHTGVGKSGSHKLNAKSLIDKAMDLGLICSVLSPKENENFRNRVVRAAQVADIVCLDWEIYDDGGDAASQIIAAIIREDAKQKGRLRLIAIYTGDSTNNKILDKILNTIPKKLRDAHEFQRSPLTIQSKNGVRIVCLFKTHGIQLPPPRNANQVGEDRLPERLQTEFATLSEGLLSNVALATIASIRSSTHHVLSKFTRQMDGPFFHHRALIESPDDAEEYAVDIVLSELKGAIDKQWVAAKYAGPKAIDDRVHEIAKGAATRKLHYENEKKPCAFDLDVDVAVKIVTDGLRPALKNEKPPGAPKNKVFEENLSTLFSDDQEAARAAMHEFAALTGIRAYPGSRPYHSDQLFPRLGLGTIIRDKDKSYLMCLQASCDSVRVKKVGNFLFVPLDTEDIKPEHVIPIPRPRSAHKFDYIGLSTSAASYRVVRSIKFLSCQETETVNAKRIKNRSGFYFEDTDGKSYLWIADLKRQRALRTVQRLGQHMGRLGFDEFEPYRQKEREI